MINGAEIVKGKFIKGNITCTVNSNIYHKNVKVEMTELKGLQG